MDVGIVITGIGNWDKYTLPLINSIQEQEPKVKIVVIDNASEPPYPKKLTRVTMRRTERLCYSAAINYGFSALGKRDWYMSMNNDVFCHAPFVAEIEKLSPDAIYSRQIIQEKGVTWFGNWIVLIPAIVWDIVGQFDENFQMCGFEDADYSIRADKQGIPTRPMDLNFHHFWGKTRWQLPKYEEVRVANQEYLFQKHKVWLGNNPTVVHT